MISLFIEIKKSFLDFVPKEFIVPCEIIYVLHLFLNLGFTAYNQGFQISTIFVSVFINK